MKMAAGAFTSGLSVNGFALCDSMGLRPLRQVMGSSIYQVGFQQSTWPMMMGGTVVVELDTLSEGWNEVRRRALDRLTLEATHAGADAVVGVELRTDAHDFAEGAIEYVVFGTAVRRERAERHGAPVLTELSVSDYAKLVRAGFEPVGIVAWSAVFFASYSFGNVVGLPVARESMAPPRNYELREYTEAFYSARAQVMERIGAQAQQLGAAGIVGVRIAHSAQPHTTGSASMQFGAGERRGLMLTFHAIGTAIRERESAQLYPPEPTIDLTA